MSNSENADAVIQGLSKRVTSVFEHALEKLKDDPKRRFFPYGINEVYVKIALEGASAELNVSGVAAPGTEGGALPAVVALIHPMVIYSGSARSLRVHLSSGVVCNVMAKAGEWDIFDLVDGTQPKGTNVPFPPPTHAPGTNQALVMLVTPAGAPRGTATFDGINATLDDNTWYMLDFTKKTATPQSPF